MFDTMVTFIQTRILKKMIIHNAGKDEVRLLTYIAANGIVNKGILLESTWKFL